MRLRLRCVSHLSKLRSDGYVILPTRAREPLHIRRLAEQQAMRRATKMEHAELVALGDMLPSADGDLTRADLDHADGDERHEPNGGVVRFDEDNRARGDGGVVPLARDGARDVDVVTVVRRIRIAQALEERLGVVRAVADKRLDDPARDGRVPAVVRERGEERLVHSATVEMGRERVEREHVEERVLLALEPELVPQLAAVRDVVALRLARVGDDRVVVGRGDGPHTVAERAREEGVPGRVPVVRFRRVAVEELLKGVRRRVLLAAGRVGRVVRDGGQVGSAVWAEPTGGVVPEALLRRRFRFEEVAPDV